ncbi:MAG: RNA polymerase subunit sigma-24 [Acidobacteria bacterium]|nr:MAG: RNA polymerase subunit sigma-24 [Acidobacteriota bacterium]HTC77640.1 RNA polymerase sigma factor [Terriglobales bacterium]
MSIEQIYREESGRILASLIRLLGDFDLAEEALQDAFAAALVQWPKAGKPANPRAWLVSAGRNKAVDRLRRRALLEAKREELARLNALAEEVAEVPEETMLRDDRLRLIFTCCHPALAREAQVPLTLRTLCGLSTEEIAHAFLVPLPTMAQRLVRAKQKIRDAGIPYHIPAEEELPERIEAVLLVVYLVFNEGYNASAGDALVRRELCHEAIRLGRLLHDLMPGEVEAQALLALMLLHDSRRDARTSESGEIVLLEEQDRSRWHRDQIAEGLELVENALARGARGPYALQAAIAALHAQAKSAQATDWHQIAALYELLLQAQPSPVIELNRAVAVAMAHGLPAGLRLLDELEERRTLPGYYLLPAARGDLLRRMERWDEAEAAYSRALALVGNDAERRFLSLRLMEVREKIQSEA